MASQVESHRAGAEIVSGDGVSRKKSIELLEELGLPKGLLPLEDIEEFGYNKETGFMWLVQRKKKIEHTFKKIKQTGKLKKIAGVKTKELMLWLSVVEVYVAEASPEKILLRIPPDEPASLVRASLVCKPWRRIITDPAFLRRYRAFHRTPPMLGFLHNVDGDKAISSAPRFVPTTTTASSPFSPPAIGSPHWWWALDCRHGRVLINLFNPMELMVWDPIIGDQHRFPVPPHPHAYCTGAVLCAARDCRHLDCHQGPFLVVFVGSGEHGYHYSWACLYSSETGEWSSKASIVFDSYVEMSPSLLVEDMLFFICENGIRILGYDIGSHELWEIEPPLWDDYQGGTLMTAEDGGLGFATMETRGLVLWSWYVDDDDGIADWEQLRVIKLEMLIPVDNPSVSLDLVGFIEGTQTIFVSSDVGVFAIELKSGQVKKVGDSRPYYSVLPYMSFYTSGGGCRTQLEYRLYSDPSRPFRYASATYPMASQIESHRSGAEIVNGDAICRKKSIELLEELGLPKGLLPLEDIEEFGYNRGTGFMWLVQKKKKIEHTFKKIKQTVSYANEVTAFTEKGKLKKITGVKTKELLLWLSVVEVYVTDALPDKVTFKTGTGLSETFDAAAFALGDRPRLHSLPTAFVEKGKLKKITGVKTKELLLWLSVVEVYVADASPEKVTFKTGTGLSDTFDATAFALGDPSPPPPLPPKPSLRRRRASRVLPHGVCAGILLRIPPDEPAHLVHASLVCKPWRRILTDPAFLRRYRAFHRTPPVLGFLHNVDGNKAISSVPRFVPTTAASPFSPPAIDPPNWWWALDCRHGRVLSHLFNPMELMVWDPITGDQHRFPLPPHPHAYCTGAVLCAASDRHHLDCHQGPFLVVFVGTGRHDHSWACVYSSETGEWSSHASIVLDSYVEMLPSVLAENTLYFYCEYGTKILGYDIGKHELSEIDPPLGHDDGILIESEYGGLGFATVEACGLVLWSQYVCYDGIEEWEQSRIIELDMLIPNFFYSGGLVGFAEGTDIIFMLTDVDLFAIELKSGQVKKVGESRPYYAVIPYMSFYTSDLARKRLAQPAGMQ
uniref:Uncharacterized protein n=1 Tax=Oryza glumipatula TaxID=40148 RepID=A0A0E0AFA4_9ORYZ